VDRLTNMEKAVMTKKKLKPLIVLVFLSIGFLLVSCASTSTMTNDERTKAYIDYIVSEKLESMDRITSFRFDGFSSLSDEYLIISTGVKRSYLITLGNFCVNLRFSNSIRIHNSGSSLQTKFDSISVPQDMGIGTKCFIKEIHKLSVEQKKEILKIGKKTDEEKD